MSNKRRARSLTVAFCAAMALAAVMASSAFAVSWGTSTTEGGAVTKFTEGQSETVAPSAVTPMVLIGKVGSTPIKLTAKKLAGKETKITQTGASALASGSLVFSEITVNEPSTCTLASVETKALKAEVLMGNTEATKANTYLKFLPKEGEIFASFKLSGTCAIAGTTIQVKTTKGVFALANPTGTTRVNQNLTFSTAINSSQGGNLFTGENAAELSGEGTNSLSGGLSGKFFGAS